MKITPNFTGYKVIHDGKSYTPEKIIEHLRVNRHPREPVDFTTFSKERDSIMEDYNRVKEIADRIDKIFEEEQRIRR